MRRGISTPNVSTDVGSSLRVRVRNVTWLTSVSQDECLMGPTHEHAC